MTHLGADHAHGAVPARGDDQVGMPLSSLRCHRKSGVVNAGGEVFHGEIVLLGHRVQTGCKLVFVPDFHGVINDYRFFQLWLLI